MTSILAAIGVLVGLGGLAVGGYALWRTRRAADDCRALVHRLLPEGSGVDVRAIRDVGVVRYDALEEMSGARSFSLALLNAAGDGIVVTSINGRTESRTYAKAVQGGRAAEELSPEEYRAIRAARMGRQTEAAGSFPAPEEGGAVRTLVPGARAAGAPPSPG
ncbi:DUF4446 family protein [Nocardiopsis sp. RSe5-2]|uniref:DUF4446 family protein n=1 Tax=Nocardiopsis endophytica TaxID=3018445 RepID=A0ABT4U381_9ACTN|nr:DUF4446 family protein [Nocardiopsis endophytica]MDA2811390.1 DUF4446 family protein [Nocardiopsis endophytica]